MVRLTIGSRLRRSSGFPRGCTRETRRLAVVLLFAVAGPLCAGVPDPCEPAEHYAKAFRSEPEFEDRLRLVPELTLAHLGDGRLPELPGLFRTVVDDGDPWQEAAYRAEMFAALGDARAEYRERREVYAEHPGDLDLLDRLWDLAVQVRDWDGAVTFSRVLAEESGERVHGLDHGRLLIRRGKDAAFREFLERRGETLFSIRELFPELHRHEKLDLAAAPADAARTDADGDWRALFALGEYALFRGKENEATDRFREVVASGAEGGEKDTVAAGFRRLNEAYFTRFASLRNRALASGSFGAQPNIDYSFFGMRERFLPETRGQARDAAVLYWKYDALARNETRLFLERLADALDEADLSHGERILAVAIAGAPAAMMDEVERYFDSGARDEATDRFILRAVNRYAPSLESFPELREPMVDATNRISRRLAGAAEDGRAPEDLFRQRVNLLNRLGETGEVERLIEARRDDLSEESGVEGLWENLTLAFDRSDRPAAERIFDRLLEAEGGRDSFSGQRYRESLLHFAAWRWDETGDREGAGRYLREYLRSLEAEAGEPDGTLFSVRSWWDSQFFPPGNPYWDGQEMSALYRSVDAFLEGERFGLMRETLDALARERSSAERGPLRFLETCLLWWRGQPMAAKVNLAEAVEETGDPYLRFLAAFLAARDHRARQVEAFLEGRETNEETEFQIAALRFLLAAETEDRPGMDRVVAVLTDRDQRPNERLAWAGVLSEAGYARESLDLLRELDPGELGEASLVSFFETLFAAMSATGKPEEAANLAASRLLRNPPVDFDGIGTGARRRAFEVIEAAGKREAYRARLREAREVAPGSFSIRLLVAESDLNLPNGPGKGKPYDLLREAAGMRANDFETQFGYARWLYRNDRAEEAVAVYDDLLLRDAPHVMVNAGQLLDTYEAAGALATLGAFFESWEIPQARSIDEFYGLQPTNHLLDALGVRLSENGNTGSAVRVWETGVRLNPVAFAETMRVRLAKALWEKGREDAYWITIEDYLFRDEPVARKGLWMVQPFASPVPRWLATAHHDRNGEFDAPLLRMLEPARAAGDRAEALVRRAETWRAEDPDDLSRRAFHAVALALTGSEDVRREAGLDGEEDAAPEREAVLELLEEWLRSLRADQGWNEGITQE